MKIDHEMIYTVILLPSADSRRVVVSYKLMYVHEVLVNHLVKLARKSVVSLTDRPEMTIAIDQSQPTNQLYIIVYDSFSG